MSSAAIVAASTLWSSVGLPASTLSHLALYGPDPFPSSFQLGTLATSTVGVSALAASQLLTLRAGRDATPSDVSVSAADATAEFRCEQLGTLEGKPGKVWDELVGVYEAKDGKLRPHTNWRHHKVGLLELLGLKEGASKGEVVEAFANVEDASAFADTAMEKGLVVTALRSFDEWCVPYDLECMLSCSLTILLVQGRPPARPGVSCSSRRPNSADLRGAATSEATPFPHQQATSGGNQSDRFHTSDRRPDRWAHTRVLRCRRPLGCARLLHAPVPDAS